MSKLTLTTNPLFSLFFSCTVDGLPLNEIRVLVEKSTTCPETRDEKNRKVEFATPSFNLLNALEQMGYKVITSGAFVTGHKKFDQGGTNDHSTDKIEPSAKPLCFTLYINICSFVVTQDIVKYLSGKPSTKSITF
jgi:hypothetical protein